MNYTEVNRTVEPHSECVLVVYLQDANGTPVPNVQLKIWGGPPPTGEPPYYVDDDPDNPNRRTDVHGKFQFEVANPSPSNPLDFYARVLGADASPASDPIHFPFPAGESCWIVVTLAPPRALPPGDAPVPLPASQLDARPASEVGTIVQPVQTPVERPAPLPAPAPRPSAPPSTATPKLFAHYMLFGSGSQPATLTYLILALDYIIRFAPLVGFSADQAKFAQHVTIVGDAAMVSDEAEQGLRAAGCMVARLTASDSYALENVLKQLIASGSPYPS